MKWTFTQKTYDTLYALDSFSHYWLSTERLIEKDAVAQEMRAEPESPPIDEDELLDYQIEKSMARHLHDEVMTPIFRHSCVAMLYTIVERELKRLVENLENERGAQKLKATDIRESSYLLQVAKFADVFLNVQLKDCPQYQKICD